MPVDSDGLTFLKEKNIPFSPELQIQLIQIAEFELGGKYLSRHDVENLKHRIAEIQASIQKHTELIAEKLPPGSPSYSATIESIDVVHVPNMGKSPAGFKVRGRTSEGFLVPVRKVPSPGNIRLEKKRDDVVARFKGLIGETVAFRSQESINGRLYLVPMTASIPEEFQTKADKSKL